MIKLVRIDDRLVHGQVAFTWVSALGIDCLIVANDKVAEDDFLKMTMGLAKPANVKLVILTIQNAIAWLTDPRGKNLKVLVLVNSVNDASYLSNGVSEIKSINFGGIRIKEGAKLISKAIALNEDDIAIIRQLAEKGLELEIRQVPSDKKQMIQNLI